MALDEHRGDSAVSSALPARQTMSIGEVLSRLRVDFPDVTISKIRFWETEGLIEPQRAPSGYRRFTDDDVARLRYICTVKRDHYLPLDVIKEQLGKLDRGMSMVADGERPITPYTEASRPAEAVRLSRGSFVEAAGIDYEVLAELESHGLVAPDRQDCFDDAALLVARTAGELAAHGLEPRHLRSLRTAAEREVGLVEQAIAGIARQRSADAQARAADVATEIARLTGRLHAAFIEAGIRRLGR